MHEPASSRSHSSDLGRRAVVPGAPVRHGLAGMCAIRANKDSSTAPDRPRAVSDHPDPSATASTQCHPAPPPYRPCRRDRRSRIWTPTALEPQLHGSIAERRSPRSVRRHGRGANHSACCAAMYAVRAVVPERRRACRLRGRGRRSTRWCSRGRYSCSGSRSSPMMRVGLEALAEHILRKFQQPRLASLRSVAERGRIVPTHAPARPAASCRRALSRRIRHGQVRPLRTVEGVQLVHHQVAQRLRPLCAHSGLSSRAQQQEIQHLVVGEQDVGRVLPQRLAVVHELSPAHRPCRAAPSRRRCTARRVTWPRSRVSCQMISARRRAWSVASAFIG